MNVIWYTYAQNNTHTPVVDSSPRKVFSGNKLAITIHRILLLCYYIQVFTIITIHIYNILYYISTSVHDTHKNSTYV